MTSVRSDMPDWVDNPSREKVRQDMLTRIDHWNQVYSPKVEDNGKVVPLLEEDSLVLKLIFCWCHHWQTAGSGYQAQEVADRVESGYGYTGNGYLGGNPFFDLFLVSAICRMSNKAHDIFLETFGNYLSSIAVRVLHVPFVPFCRHELPNWWTALFFYLTRETATQKAPLNTYRGNSGLKLWLRMTVSLYFIATLKKKKERNFSDIVQDKEDDFEWNLMEAPKAPPISDELWNDIQKRFINALEWSKSQMEPEYWTRLYLFYVKKLQNQQIAILYKEDDATTTRKRTKAEKDLALKLNKAIDDDPVLYNSREIILEWLSMDIADLMFRYFSQESDQKEAKNER